MHQLTPEQQEDFAKRRDEFLADYKALIDKHQCDFMSFPSMVPTPHGFFVTTIQTDVQDTKFLPVKSPSEFTAHDNGTAAA